MNRSFGRLFAVILAFGTFGAHRSLACTCLKPFTAVGNCADLKATGPSFVGTVIDIKIRRTNGEVLTKAVFPVTDFEWTKTSVDSRIRRLMFTQGEVLGTAVTIFGGANRIS